MLVDHACILKELKLETTSSQKASCLTHKTLCQTTSFLATGGLTELLKKSHDFSMIVRVFFKFHDFSMDGTFL